MSQPYAMLVKAWHKHMDNSKTHTRIYEKAVDGYSSNNLVHDPSVAFLSLLMTFSRANCNILTHMKKQILVLPQNILHQNGYNLYGC